MTSRTVHARAVALVALAALTGACGSRTIGGGEDLPDGSTVDVSIVDTATVDTGVDVTRRDVPDASVDTPIAPDADLPDGPVGPDVFPDVVTPDVPTPDVPVTPDVVFPDVPVTPDVVTPDVPVTPDVVTPDVPTPPTSGTCAGAAALTPGVTLTGQSTFAAVESGPACAPVLGPRPSVWYRLTVPAGQTASLTTVRTDSTGTLQARVYTGGCMGTCIPTTAIAGSDGRTSLVQWRNTSSSPVEYTIALNAVFIGPVLFTVTATTRAPAPNGTCDGATVVRDGTALRGEDLSLSSTQLAPCPGSPLLSQPGTLFYAVDVPAGSSVTGTVAATVAGRGTFQIRVVPACGDATCLAASATPATNTSTSWTNTGSAPRRVLLAVTSTSALGTQFDLSVRVRTPPTNATCAGATRITAGTLTGESFAFARETNTACLAFGSTGTPVLYYVARVGAGERLTVSARRTSSSFFQPVVRLIDACASSTCLATSAGMTGSADTGRLTWVNPGAARDVVVMVSANTAALDGTFDLSTAVGAVPYRMEMIPAACDTLSMPTPTGVSGDDSGGASTALPFAFRYFGTAVTGWSVSTNGYAQLWATTGMSTGSLNPMALPAASAAPSMVAPFWDDLLVDGTVGTIRSQTFATPQHLTVEWNNVRFCCGMDSGERLTFQAKFFAATNVIEFHYCALSTTPRATGQRASIGIQDATTTQGLSWSAMREGAVSATTGIRFTPTTP